MTFICKTKKPLSKLILNRVCLRGRVAAFVDYLQFLYLIWDDYSTFAFFHFIRKLIDKYGIPVLGT
jgi:hypothetical protein